MTATTMRDLMMIVESQSLASGELYHGTSIVNAAAIVSGKMLIADDSHGDAAGVSFTRSQKLGWEFAGIAEERALTFDYDKRPEGSPSGRGALLVFDAVGLRTEHPKALQPYVYGTPTMALTMRKRNASTVTPWIPNPTSR